MKFDIRKRHKKKIYLLKKIDEEWDVMVDLFYYKTIEESDKNAPQENVNMAKGEEKEEGNWDQGKNDEDQWAQPLE